MFPELHRMMAELREAVSQLPKSFTWRTKWNHAGGSTYSTPRNNTGVTSTAVVTSYNFEFEENTWKT